MKKLVIAIIATLFAANMAFAADAGCEAKAAEKKLAGAAKGSFMKKCEKDAAATAPVAATDCTVKAAEKKLAGAAKNSFMKNVKQRAPPQRLSPPLPLTQVVQQKPQRKNWLVPLKTAS